MSYNTYPDSELRKILESLKKDFLIYKKENKTFSWKECEKDMFEIELIIEKRAKLQDYRNNILPKLLLQKSQIKERLKKTCGSNKEDHEELKKIKEKLKLGIYIITNKQSPEKIRQGIQNENRI